MYAILNADLDLKKQFVFKNCKSIKFVLKYNINVQYDGNKFNCIHKFAQNFCLKHYIDSSSNIKSIDLMQLQNHKMTLDEMSHSMSQAWQWVII